MTFHDLLRRYFGWNHIITVPAVGWHYTPQDLRRDLRLRKYVRSLGGHAMRPFVDFGELDERLVWYTILRDPIERSISNYQHQFEKLGSTMDFHSWLARDCNQNWHVRMLAGEQDLSAAKQILATKMHCIGNIERYNEFLLLLRHRLNWPGFNITYRRPRNPPLTNDVRQRIKADIEVYIESLQAANELDLALYEYAMTELYPKQIEEYGSEKMARDLETEFRTPVETVTEKFRRWQGVLFEKGVYPPLVKLARKTER
jgi:hypothetical protein